MAVSGVMPLITGWHNDNERHREVFLNIPGPLQLAFYTIIPILIVWGSFQFANRMKNWERGAPRPDPPHQGQERRASREGLPRRRLHADPAARLGRRADALDDLLRIPGAARRHDRPRDRPPDARGPQVPPRPHLPGLCLRGRRRRRRVPRRHRLGDRASLRAAPVPHPHQVQARARRHPRHVPRHRRHRLRRRDVPARPAAGRRREHGLRALELHRLPAQLAGRPVVGVVAGDLAPVVVDRSCPVVRRVPGDPADHDAAPHLHVPAEHVSARTRTVPRAP